MDAKELEMVTTVSQPTDGVDARLRKIEERLETLSRALHVPARPRVEESSGDAVADILARADAQIVVVKRLVAVLQQETSGWDSVDQAASAMLLRELELLCQGLRAATGFASLRLAESGEVIRRTGSEIDDMLKELAASPEAGNIQRADTSRSSPQGATTRRQT